MLTTIDKAGRLVIPKDIRRQAGLESGMQLEIRYCPDEGHVEIEPVRSSVHLERRGYFTVMVPDGPVDPLTAEETERVRQEIHEERARRFLGLE